MSTTARLSISQYDRMMPADILLVIDVADSSLQCDRDEKASLYAEAGIGDY